MILDLAREIGRHFTHEQYMFWSRIEGTAWTIADVVIVYYLIRISNLCRAYLGLARRIVPFVVLAATLPPAAFIPFVSTARTFFLVELGVTIPHFLLILWIITRDAPIVLEAVRRRAGGCRTGTGFRGGGA